MKAVPALVAVAAATVAGAAVMLVEVAGAHVLAPGFGTGLNAWSAMIVVALGGLACGYALGGWLADRLPRRVARVLFATLTLAGLCCIADALLWEAVVTTCAPLGAQGGAVVAAAVLFFLAFLALGAAYPMTVRLWTRSLAQVGRRSGLLSAASAVGSLGGAALAGFVLVPALEIETIFLGCAAVLLVAAAVVLLAGGGSKLAAAALLVVACGTALLPARPRPADVLHRGGSMFGPLEVRQIGIMRYLMVADTAQGIARVDEDGAVRGAMPHVRAISRMLAESLPHEAGGVLLIGLGAGLLPRALEPIPCRSVEIDPAVVDAARRFFGFDPARHPVHVADGRAFLGQGGGVYDAIVVDALRGIDLPYHLLTREFFALARSRLHRDGVLVVNYQGFLAGEGDRLLRAIERTLRAVYDEVEICFAEEAAEYGSVLFAAHRRGIDVQWPPVRGYRLRSTFLDERPAAVLTDRRNPVALWCAQLERRRRRTDRDR
jgi:spermidine synthase